LNQQKDSKKRFSPKGKPFPFFTAEKPAPLQGCRFPARRPVFRPAASTGLMQGIVDPFFRTFQITFF
jgi:hypothetical protein